MTFSGCAGNLKILASLSNFYITLKDGVLEPSKAMLNYRSTYLTSMASSPLTDASYIRAFVSGLFQVSQGVE